MELIFIIIVLTEVVLSTVKVILIASCRIESSKSTKWVSYCIMMRRF